MPAAINKQLPRLPPEEEILAAVGELDAARRYAWPPGSTANELARKLGVRGARRLGNGAMKGSWSGTLSASVRLSPRLRAMARRGLLVETYVSEDYRHVYRLPGQR